MATPWKTYRRVEGKADKRVKGSRGGIAESQEDIYSAEEAAYWADPEVQRAFLPINTSVRLPVRNHISQSRSGCEEE